MKAPLTRAAMLCGLLASAGLFLSNARKPEAELARTSLSQFPMTIGTWRAVVDPPLEKEILAVLGVDDYLSRVYYQPNAAGVGLYMGYYGSQRQGDTIHSPQNCLPGAGWEPISEGRLQMPNVDGAGRDITINRYVIQKGLDQNVVLYWYHGRGRVIANEYWSRAMLIRDALITNRTNGSLVRVIVPVLRKDQGNQAPAEALAQEFVRAIFPSLDSYLP
jgi:EpsI family protein